MQVPVQAVAIETRFLGFILKKREKTRKREHININRCFALQLELLSRPCFRPSDQSKWRTQQCCGIKTNRWVFSLSLLRTHTGLQLRPESLFLQTMIRCSRCIIRNNYSSQTTVAKQQPVWQTQKLCLNTCACEQCGKVSLWSYSHQCISHIRRSTC